MLCLALVFCDPWISSPCWKRKVSVSRWWCSVRRLCCSAVCAQLMVVMISLRRLIFPVKITQEYNTVAVKSVCGGHGLRFVMVRHAPGVAGETRLCSDVGSSGGGDVADSDLEVGRIASRCRLGWLGNGFGPKRFVLFLGFVFGPLDLCMVFMGLGLCSNKI